jgi:hypothetical protein
VRRTRMNTRLGIAAVAGTRPTVPR